MTARYSDAEKAAAKRIGYGHALRGAPYSAEWLADFRGIYASLKHSAASIRRCAKRMLAQADRYDARVADAALVARAIAREQRRAARS